MNLITNRWPFVGQAGAADRRVEQILWSSVEFGEITLRASGCGGATSSVPDAHWILGRFITAVFGSLVLGLPLQSLPGMQHLHTW